MTTWADTSAGLLAGGGDFPGDDRAARREAAELERQQHRAEFEAAMTAADPSWREARARQAQVAEFIKDRGQVINIKNVVPPELAGLYAAQAAAQTTTGTVSAGVEDAAYSAMLAPGRARLAEAQAAQSALFPPDGPSPLPPG